MNLSRTGTPFLRVVPLLVALVCSPSAPLVAQDKLGKADTPIDVEVADDPALVGSEIEIRGSSVPLDELTTVTLRVVTPGGSDTSTELPLDDDNRFAMRFVVTELGQHTVVATAPDGKAHARVRFQAANAAGYSQAAVDGVAEVLEAASQALTEVGSAVAEAPVSPPQQELAQRVAELQARAAEIPAQVKQMSEMVKEAASIVDQYPSTQPEFAPLFDAFSEVNQELPQAQSVMQERVKDLSVGISDCDRLDMAAEALNAVGLALGMIGKPVGVAINLLADKTFSTRVSARIPGLAANEGAKLAVDNSVKHSVALAQGVDSWLSGVTGYVTDAATFAAQQVFGVYCEKFEGPFNADFKLQYFEGNERWLGYRVQLSGMLFLRYEKGTSPIRVTGEFEGVANFPGLVENYLVIESWAKPYTLVHWADAPIGGVFLPEGGKLGRAALGMLRVNPGYFYVPVEGILEGDTLTFKFLDATQDYPERAKGRVIYVLLEPTLLIPHIAKLEVDYFGAHYILSRGTHTERGTSAEPISVKVKVDQATKTSVIEESFTRKEEDSGSFELDWTVSWKACNPGCAY